MIESYQFGKMVIDGQVYTSDLILYPDHIDDSWWRKSGHNVCIDDIQEILAVQLDCLVVGTGKPGLMNVLPETRDLLVSKDIELIAEPTSKAVQTYNRLQSSRQVVGAFHLTC